MAKERITGLQDINLEKTDLGNENFKRKVRDSQWDTFTRTEIRDARELPDKPRVVRKPKTPLPTPKE